MAGIIPLPTTDGVGLYVTDAGALTFVSNLAKSRSDLAAVSGDGTHVGVVDMEGKRGRIWAMSADGVGIEKLVGGIHLPRGCTARGIAMVADVLFAGGDAAAGQCLQSLDPKTPNPAFRAVPMPADLQGNRPIDALLVHRDRLIAVDNIVFPKYLLEYDVSSPREPRAMRVVEIPTTRPYLHIHSAAVSDRFIALASRYEHRGGVGRLVHVHDASDLTEVGIYESVRTWDAHEAGAPWTSERGLAECVDVALSGSTLYVAGREAGVGIADLSDAAEGLRSITYGCVDGSRVFAVRAPTGETGCFSVAETTGGEVVHAWRAEA